MSLWLNKANFPNLLYCRVNNSNEYIAAVSELKNVLNVDINYDGEVYNTEIQPFDNKSWCDYFLTPTVKSPFDLNIDSFKKKPLESEYPIVLSFSCNHTYLHWISLSDLI